MKQTCVMIHILSNETTKKKIISKARIVMNEIVYDFISFFSFICIDY